MSRAEWERLTRLERVQHAAEDVRCLFPNLGRKYIGGEGGPSPRVMVVGDGPSALSETAHRPFGGHVGVVLRQLVGVAGLELDECWFTNLLKYRPPGGRVPTFHEARAFRNVLMAEWKAIGRPPRIIAVGPAVYVALIGKGNVPERGTVVQLTSRVHMVLARSPVEGLMRPELREEIEQEWESLNTFLRIKRN